MTAGVYIAFGRGRGVLYVGSSRNVDKRVRQQRSAPWWQEASKVEIRNTESAFAAEQLERHLIASLSPKYNVIRYEYNAVGRQTLPERESATLVEYVEASRACGRKSVEDQRLSDLIKALYSRGWTYQAIAEPLGWTREAVRIRVNKGADLTGLPYLAHPPAPPRIVKAPRPQIGAPDKIILRALYAAAFKCRGHSAPDSPYRLASIEYTRRIALLRERGFTIDEIASAVDVTHNAIIARLGRHGHRTPSPSVAHHPTFGTKSRADRSRCHRGHSLSGDNLHIVSTTGARVCIECRRRRTRAYQARQRVAS